jgi:hypothetical protein
MSAFATAVALVGALAWPVVVLVIVLIFRPQLNSALGRVTRVDLPGFSTELAKVALLASDTAPPATGGRAVDLTDVRRLATVDPARAVESAWQKVLETDAAVHHRSAGISGGMSMLTGGPDSGLDPRQAAVAETLYRWNARAQAAPDRIDATDALVYIQAAEELCAALMAGQAAPADGPT